VAAVGSLGVVVVLLFFLIVVLLLLILPFFFILDKPTITRFATLELGKDRRRDENTCTQTSAALVAVPRLKMSGNELPFALHLAGYIYTSYRTSPSR
jgi:hypothetical protein